MIKVKANIKLYSNGRETPFTTGYRPLFNFIAGMKISGQINLKNKMDFSPGDHGDVEIFFSNSKYFGADFGIGKKFTFDEGGNALGEGVISEIISM